MTHKAKRVVCVCGHSQNVHGYDKSCYSFIEWTCPFRRFVPIKSRRRKADAKG